MNDKSDWHRACLLSELHEQGPIGKTIGGHAVAIFRLGDAVYAIGDICTHELAYLSEGYQEGDTIECPLHQAQFSVVTGKCLQGPATEDVESFPTRVEGGEIFVRVPVKND